MKQSYQFGKKYARRGGGGGGGQSGTEDSTQSPITPYHLPHNRKYLRSTLTGMIANYHNLID